jgi:putative Holliday junction resolvase
MPDETLLAFDFGLKRIGVALGTTRLGQARALDCINTEANDTRFAAIGRLIGEWQPTRLLVGRPLNDDGTAHEMTARCERFAHQLRGRFQLPVEEIDERFSSVEAEAALRQHRLSWQERKTRIDAEAARIILQSWFDTHVHAAA